MKIGNVPRNVELILIVKVKEGDVYAMVIVAGDALSLVSKTRSPNNVSKCNADQTY